MAGRDALLRTVLTVAHPVWARFRGAEYAGTAAHDPLEQNLLAHIVARACPRLSRALALHIARLACTPRAFPSTPAVRVLRLVCRPDTDGARIARAALLSRQIRRFLRCIPHGSALWARYRAWTLLVAGAVGAAGRAQHMHYLGSDAAAPHLAGVNRLHLRGFAALDARRAREHARPAYLPSAALLAEWTAEFECEAGPDALLRFAAQVRAGLDRTQEEIQRYVVCGRRDRAVCRGDKGCAALVEQDAKAHFAYHRRVYHAITQLRLLRGAAELYSQLYALGLNAAERDYVFMLSAGDEHSTTAP